MKRASMQHPISSIVMLNNEFVKNIKPFRSSVAKIDYTATTLLSADNKNHSNNMRHTQRKDV